MHKIASLFLATLLSSALTACAAHDAQTGTAPLAVAPAAPAVPPQPAVAGQGGDTLARIHALVGVPSCSSDAQCKALALGARPCGGPEGFLAYSSARTPEPELRALADTYRDERHAANSRSGMMSNCLARPEPGAVCQTGVCTLTPASTSAPAPAPVAR
jgi:hypothetical protein